MHKTDYRQEFPVFKAHPELIYLDSAASSLRAQPIIDAMSTYASHAHANIHRGAYKLSYEATERYESVRKKVADWIHAKYTEEVIFTQGTTDSMNHLMRFFESDEAIIEGDKIVLSIFEHHSNLVPWQQLAKKKGLILEYLYDFSEESLKKIDEKTRIVAITLMSNAVGLIVPIDKIVKRAHDMGAVVVGDGAQYIAHRQVDVVQLDIDFLAFSGHKIFGPTGIGILYGKHDLLEEVAPQRFGGDMIEYVREQTTTFAGLPNKLEAGTPNIDGVIGLGAAVDYVIKNNVQACTYLDKLREYTIEKIASLAYIRLVEPLKGQEGIEYGPIISFTVKDVHPHDVASILDQSHIAIRAGHHCAQPLMQYLGVTGTCRISFSIYNKKEDVDALITALKSVRRWLGYES